MPSIPAQEQPTVAPSGPVGAFQRGNASPASFGAFTGQAQERMGADFERLARATEAMQGMQDETRAKEADRKLNDALLDLQFNPKSGFQTRMGKDAVDGYQGVFDAAHKAYNEIKDGLPNMEAQRMFENAAQRSLRYSTESMASHAAQQNKVWVNAEGEGRIKNLQDVGAAYWNDDVKFASTQGAVRDEAIQLAEFRGLGTQGTQALITHYTSQSWQARIRATMAQDVDKARVMFDANAAQMDEAHRSQMESQISSHEYTTMVRDNARDAKEERLAERKLRQTQSNNEANLLADVLSGKPVRPGTLADMLRTQQISPAGMSAVLTLAKRDPNAPDNSVASLDLYRRFADHTLSVQDVYDAGRSGAIKGTTARTLMTAIASQEKRGDDAVTRQARSAALAAAGVPDGLINLTHEEAARKAQVETEWTNRVMVNGEDAIKVRDELMQKYQPPGRPPLTWPAPRFGQVNSLAEVAATAQKTKDALSAGTISQDQYQAQGELLSRYQTFFARLEAARAAAQPAKPAPGEKAKVRGLAAQQ